MSSHRIKFNPLVSIIIPVYNGSNYLREAINSALAQTYKNIEIIVVNDGSIDDTDQIARSYGDKIRYFAKDNGGTSTALNVGIKNMRGEYFSWLSHDDTYYPNKIECQINELSQMEDKTTVLLSDLDGINQNYEKVYRTDYLKYAKKYPSRLAFPIYPIIYMQLHGCTLLIHRSCFDKVGLFDEKCLVAQDFEMFYRIFSKYKYKYVPNVLVTARDHSVRQGIRSRAKGSYEYSKLFISIIDSLSEEEVLLLAPTVLSFYKDMEEMFREYGYIEGLEYIKKKIVKNLQINYTDIAGKRFNGYDLHLSLIKKGIDSSQLVFKKESKDESTYLCSSPDYLKQVDSFISDVENRYNIRSLSSPLSYDIMTNQLFLEADIVHYHIIHHPFFNFHLLPMMSKLKPSVWSIHDPWALTGHCIHPYECKRFEKSCGDCPDLNFLFTMTSDNTALNYALKHDIIQRSNLSIIVASEWMKKKVESSSITKGFPVYQIPFGVDQKIFSFVDKKQAKKKLGIDEDSQVIMFRVDSFKYKGIDIIRQALRQIKLNQKITLITVGAKGLMSEFKSKFNILENNWINDEIYLASLYQASDIFLMPSLAEAFGFMAIEAMSCGTMVLSVEGTALPEIINAPECGIATQRNGEIYGEELQRLLNNPNEIQMRGNKSIAYAQKNYQYDQYVNRIMEVYQEVIKNHKISEENQFVLDQLKKYMMQKPLTDVKISFRNKLIKYLKRNKLTYKIILLLLSLKNFGLKETVKKVLNVMRNKAD